MADSGLDQQLLEQQMAAARRKHLVPGREIHLQDMRGYPFSEVGLITSDGTETPIANVWNTDNLHNIYQGSDAGRAFSDICRQDSLW
jgi:hypothetical protein